MPQIKATHTFQGMDKDTADRFMKPGMYRDALNVHIGSSEGDGMFSVENVKGNTLVSYALPIGTNQVIGAHEDIINKCVYYFLCNEYTFPIQVQYGGPLFSTSIGQLPGVNSSDLVRISPSTPDGNKWIVKYLGGTNYKLINPIRFVTESTDSGYSGTYSGMGDITKFKHSILKYNLVANSISLIYQHSRLNFDINYPITGTSLIDGILSWTDAYNPPRSLNLSDAGSYGTFFIEAEIDFVRTPPSSPIITVGRFLNDSGTAVPYASNISNFMGDKSFQFIYRYVYNDNSRSVWGGISELTPTGYLDSKKNNILLTIQNEETNNFLLYSQIIKQIELGFRSEDILGFNYIDNIPFPTTTTVVTYSFFNDKPYSAIDTTETSTLFESIPIIAGAIAPMRNRVFFGDCLEGFDVTNTDFGLNTVGNGGATINPVIYNILTSPTKNVLGLKSMSIYDIGIVFYDRAQRKSGVYKLFRAKTEGVSAYIDGLYANFIPFQRYIAPELIFTLVGKPPKWAINYQIVRTKNLVKTFFLQGTFIYISRDSKEVKVLFNGLNGKISYIPAVGDFLQFINPISRDVTIPNKVPILRAEGNVLVLQNTPGTVYSQFQYLYCEIFTQGTVDPLYYEISPSYPVSSPGTSIRTFGGDVVVGGFGKALNIKTGDVSIRNLDDSFVYYSSANVLISARSVNAITDPQSIVIGTHTYTISASTASPMGAITMAQAFVDEINRIGQFEAIYISDIEDPSFSPAPGVVNNAAFFIVKAKTKGAAGNVNISTSSTFTTIYNIVTGASAQNIIDNTVFECMSPSDNLFEEWNKNIGRPNEILQYGDKQVRRISTVRYGEKYINNSNINKIASFGFLSQTDMPGSGTIRKLIPASNNQAEGSVLLCVQENEINSLYIEQTMIKNAGGGQNLSVTDDVIGTVNPLQKLVGTVNPESVVQLNGVVYGFDALRGIIWRYGQDGLNFLSDEGMRNFFYTRSSYLLSLGSFKCYAGIDPYHNEYIISIPNADSEHVTIAWSETLNKWSSPMSYIGEWYQKINTQMVSFKNGQLWLHRSNDLYNNFYGVQYTSKLQMICNQEPLTTKILQIVEEKSIGAQWDCIDIATPEGQSSELIGLYDIANPNVYPHDFTKYDNTTYVAAVMCDKNTPNMAASDYPLLRGDVIRSDIFSIVLQNNQTNKQNLYAVNLGYIYSYKNFK